MNDTIIYITILVGIIIFVLIYNTNLIVKNEGELTIEQDIPNDETENNGKTNNGNKNGNKNGNSFEFLPYAVPSSDFEQLDDPKGKNTLTPTTYPSQTLKAEDLLPGDTDFTNMFDQNYPHSQGNLSYKNFLESGHHYGINTVGSSLKNPNMQLRSDPPIPKISVGPWMQSSIEQDLNRRYFEIGNY